MSKNEPPRKQPVRHPPRTPTAGEEQMSKRPPTDVVVADRQRSDREYRLLSALKRLQLDGLIESAVREGRELRITVSQDVFGEGAEQ